MNVYHHDQGTGTAINRGDSIPESENSFSMFHRIGRAHSGRNSLSGISVLQKALILSLQEMVIQGVSTRKVQKITKELCGTTFSKSCVSDWCKRLDDEIGTWLNRPLDMAYPYLIVDARYEKVRRDHKVESNGVLIVKGINEEGYRDLLAVEVVNTENVSNWGDVFSRLIDRGLHGVQLVISDNHKGLRQAIDRYFQGC